MKPSVWLGARSSGGMALPDASPAPCQFYAPRGVFFDDSFFVAVDTGNHRVLIWRGLPEDDAQPADLVLGQQDLYSEGPKRAGTSIENGMYLPTAAGIWEGKLLIADAWHHRILVWNTVPRFSDTPPDYAIGQPDLKSVEANRGASTSREGLSSPYGMAWIKEGRGGKLYVTDTGNRRVVGWDGLPKPGLPPDYLLGQPSWERGEENRGEGVGARSFRWPHSIANVGDYVYVADAGDHRILGWRGDLTEDRDADIMFGQTAIANAEEFAYRKQGAARLRFPYAIATDGQSLAIGDTANNRILIWKALPNGLIASPAADSVIGQPDFDANGENHWKAVTPETLCWPYGLCWHKDKLAVADSGNNRVMIWTTANISRDTPAEHSLLAV